MKVSELGEFALIELLNKTIVRLRRPSAAWERLLIGIGDDAAAWNSGNVVQLATTDTLVQNVHFNPDTANFNDLGWKIIAVNISDIAAMGGQPEYALVTLCLPGDIESGDVVSLYEGMMEIANQYGVAVVGGDIVKASQLVITVTLIGCADKNNILTRSAARSGDKVAVTNYLGNSAGGLAMLQNNRKLDKNITEMLKQSHLRPVPRVDEADFLATNGVRAAIDISDGLVSDLKHIGEMSGVAAIVRADQVPIHKNLLKSFPSDCLNMALSGGEDYELLFTASDNIMTKVQNSASFPITVIGEIVKGKPGQVTILDEKGQNVPLKQKGWDHFAS